MRKRCKAIYVYPCCFIAKYLTKTGKWLSRYWPWGALCFSKAGLDLFFHAAKFYQKGDTDA